MKYHQNSGSSQRDAAVRSAAIPGWKRALDITLVLLALPILLPVMGSIAILIWVVSEGPILFRQERVGLFGSRFMCFKFRTMHVNNDNSIHRGHLENLMASDKPM